MLSSLGLDIDDDLAVAYAVGQPGIDLLALTAAYANAPLSATCGCATELATELGIAKVACGLAKPWSLGLVPAAFQDPAQRDSPAVRLIVETLKQHGQQQRGRPPVTLIGLGADKNVVDPEGCSALGHYYRAVRSTNDFHATFCTDKPQKADPALKAMLTPAGGPTAADKHCADDH